MRKRILGLFITVVFAGMAAGSFAQTTPPDPGQMLWMDDFSDTATDSAGLANMGWIRFSEADGLTGSAVRQDTTADGSNGYLYMQQGSFGVIGAVVAQTNGVPVLDIATAEGFASTRQMMVDNNFSEPNEEITFRINFFQFTRSFFYLAVRQPQNPETAADDLPVSDPTERPAYVIMLNPLVPTGNISIAKFPEVSFAGLDPTSAAWTYFGQADFVFDLDVWYWVKFYFYEGVLRAKVWEDGELEPVDWMIDGVDPAPRVTGKYMTFTVIGPPPDEQNPGEIIFIDDVMVKIVGTPSAVEPVPGEIPNTFALEQNYPNPFNPETNIEFSLERAEQVRLQIYTITGQLVRTLVNDQQPAGVYRIRFDGRDDFGRQLASGVYFYKLISPSKVLSRKMLLMK